MRILLIDDENISRHAIGMSLAVTLRTGSITAYSSFTRFHNLDISTTKYDLAILEPSAIGPSSNSRIDRVSAIKDVSARLPQDCQIIVLTNGFDPSEVQSMFEVGANNYVSKSGVDNVMLRSLIGQDEPSVVPPSEPKVPMEQFPGMLSNTEMLGYLVDQGVYSLLDVAKYSSLDDDTIKRYARRARKKLSSK